MGDVVGIKFSDLVKIIERLRQECPWDRAQTNQSIKDNLIEEAYELYEALEEDDNKKIIEELGDCLLQVIFHATIKAQLNEFNITDVIDRLSHKLISRHPHVFGNSDADTVEEALLQWDKIKQLEKNSPLDGIPKAMPVIQRALKVQERLSKIGFDFGLPNEIYKSIFEKIECFQNASQKEQKLDELGDAIFNLVNLARFSDIDPQEALHKAIDKIIKRFQATK